ncbi:MAG: hypothetical protein KIG88_08785 [Weeksellaceae bacterium]|nr:hypothetical protein [Weeksellaceae bacterium]
MKKLTLLLALFSTITFGQIQYPIAPGCEQFSEKVDRIRCFNTYTTDLLKGYFHLYSNVNVYFRLRSFQETVKFQIGTNGEYRFKALDTQSVLLNKVAADVFYAFNRIQEHTNKKIVPAKSSDGRPAILSFNLPFKFTNEQDYVNDVDKKPILFTLQNGEYIVRLDQDFTFNIYNNDNELVRTVNSIMEFHFVDVLKPLTLESKNLIVEKKENGKMIKLEVENLFKNYEADLKISYFEDDKLVKEFDSLSNFLKSEQSKYIY